MILSYGDTDCDLHWFAPWLVQPIDVEISTEQKNSVTAPPIVIKGGASKRKGYNT